MTPLRTLLRSGMLARIFSVQTDRELHEIIARLCVLFEDLRIEISGLCAEDLDRLDECGKIGRQLYFLRRSLATLFEFTEALKELDQLPAFRPIRARFHPIAERHWARALTYFEKHERHVVRMRHNVGGHFGKQAADAAVANLLPSAVGSLEIALNSKGGGAKLYFATEIVATAVLKNVVGDSSQTKTRRMMRHAVVAYRNAVWAVDCVTGTYLWERFG